MPLNFSYAASVQLAKLDAIESSIGTTPFLRLYTGSPPAGGDAAATGTLLANFALPSPDWMAAASGSYPTFSKAKTGTWSGTVSTAGTAGYFRITNATGDTIGRIQGTCGTSASDMIFDNNVLGVGQTVTINTFTITAANAGT